MMNVDRGVAPPAVRQGLMNWECCRLVSRETPLKGSSDGLGTGMYRRYETISTGCFGDGLAISSTFGLI